MQDCVREVIDGFELSANTRQDLDEAGFTVIPGPVPAEDLADLGIAYDAAIISAAPDDVKIGSTTTRVRDFVNRGPEFDRLYLSPPVLPHRLGSPKAVDKMRLRQAGRQCLARTKTSIWLPISWR